MMRLRYEPDPDWPSLAWLAICGRSSREIVVRHGTGVETHPEWFAEAVWAGPYDAGNLDCTDIVFGSGARLRDDQIIFVSAASTVDRLQSFADPAGVMISNSLPCLLHATGTTLNPEYTGYARGFRSIVRGVRRYRAELPTTDGPIRLTYYGNLRWDGHALRDESKPIVPRAFTSFARYHGFLDSCLERMVTNMTDANRSRPYQLMGTMSAGYDSPTVAVLGMQHGLREVLSFERYDLDPDSGAPLARKLGLRVLRVPRDAWKNEPPYPEVPFLAADAKGEDVFVRGAGHLLEGRVLLTGYHGDKVWDRDTSALSPDLVRGDQSGLSLSEYRLRAGFIHCPVPFLGARQIRDIHAISQSAEMAPWDTAGRYSRPICRRIVEKAGIPRTSFGVEKRVASVLFFDRMSFLTPGSLADYERWLSAHRGGKHPALSKRIMTSALHPLMRGAAHAMRRAATRSPKTLADILVRGSARITALTRREPRFRHLLPWAIEHAIQVYATSPFQTRRCSPPHSQQGASRVG